MPALGPLRDRLGAAPALHDPNTAAARLGDVEAAFPAGFLTPPLRPLLLGIADHSPFLWRLIAQAPERFAAPRRSRNGPRAGMGFDPSVAGMGE
ncbi:hypothetical protein, partial [Methylobacterium sp. WL116]|uniref:hypothetical protein n=1 Tax=Methylobacterium sp. WL116 TaxID=2603889 RepID=UPI0011C8B052